MRWVNCMPSGMQEGGEETSPFEMVLLRPNTAYAAKNPSSAQSVKIPKKNLSSLYNIIRACPCFFFRFVL